MGLTTKTLGDLLNKVNNEQLQLPEIQRDFVWKKTNVKLLFDSLYRQLPIGQMLVWIPKGELPHSKSFDHQSKKKQHLLHAASSFYGYLLDGQQRLTAIARVMDGDEEYPLVFNLWPDGTTDDDVFFWNPQMDDPSPWYPSVAEVLSPDFNITTHLNRLAKDADYKEKHAEHALNMLTRLRSILEYDISVIEYESNDYKEATKLFIRFNSTGKKLGSNDLALADLATRVPGLTEQDMGKLVAKWKVHFQFTRPFLIQCLAAVHTGRMDIKRPDEVWRDSAAGEIRNSWKITARGLGETIKFLTGTVHWNSGTWIPSYNALIPLVYLLAYNGPFVDSDRELARRWLLLTGVRAYFSGSVHTELDHLLIKLQNQTDMNQLWKVTHKWLPRLQQDDFETKRRSSPVMSLYVSMLRAIDARDPKQHTRLDGTVLGHNAGLHVHHFFPRALLLKYDKAPAEIDTFGNYTILSGDTNLDVGMEEPAKYVDRLKLREHDLELQCIPMDHELWQISRYDDFLKERRKLLAQRCNEYLGFD